VQVLVRVCRDVLRRLLVIMFGLSVVIAMGGRMDKRESDREREKRVVRDHSIYECNILIHQRS